MRLQYQVFKLTEKLFSSKAPSLLQLFRPRPRNSTTTTLFLSIISKLRILIPKYAAHFEAAYRHGFTPTRLPMDLPQRYKMLCRYKELTSVAVLFSVIKSAILSLDILILLSPTRLRDTTFVRFYREMCTSPPLLSGFPIAIAFSKCACTDLEPMVDLRLHT